MSRKLAIKGHATRGKEVIELLEMMGGKNCYNLNGLLSENTYYFIGRPHNAEIKAGEYIFGDKDMYMYLLTLEEFSEEYPFKIGDKVEVCGTNKVFTIDNMIWEDELCTVHYANMEDFEYYTAKELKLYKETNMNENKLGTAVNPVKSKSNAVGLKDDKINIDDNAIFIFNHTMSPEVNADGMLCYKIPDGYESFSIQEGIIILKPKKPTYPNMFSTCCDILNIGTTTEYLDYKSGLIESLRQLFIYRNAYWKIAGEKMGLDGPWEPKLTEMSHAIVCRDDGDFLLHRRTRAILAFPTKEMRDAFYENFKDLIEQCKELL